LEKGKLESGSSEHGEATTCSVQKASLKELLSSLAIFLEGMKREGWKGGSIPTSEKKKTKKDLEKVHVHKPNNALLAILGKYALCFFLSLAMYQ